jgi:hypothetical protein
MSPDNSLMVISCQTSILLQVWLFLAVYLLLPWYFSGILCLVLSGINLSIRIDCNRAQKELDRNRDD